MINRGVIGCPLALHFIEGEAFQGKERKDLPSEELSQLD
jgi:hypothetical protein